MSYRLSMVKLQPCNASCFSLTSCRLPLEHGKVATMFGAFGTLPIEESYRLSMVKLQLEQAEEGDYKMHEVTA